MTKDTLRLKLMISIGSILLLTSEVSFASDAHFDYEFRQHCGQNMNHVNDIYGAQSALNFLSAWVNSPNLTIKQKTLETAEALITKWELNPPSWFSAILPQAQATTEQIYQEVSSHVPNEPLALTEVKDELKDVIEAEVLHAKVHEKEGILPAILSESPADNILKQHPEVQQQVEEAGRKNEAAIEIEDQDKKRAQARQELNEKLEAQQKLGKEEQESRHLEAQAQIQELIEEKKEQAAQQHEAAKGSGDQ